MADQTRNPSVYLESATSSVKIKPRQPRAVKSTPSADHLPVISQSSQLRTPKPLQFLSQSLDNLRVETNQETIVLNKLSATLTPTVSTTPTTSDHLNGHFKVKDGTEKDSDATTFAQLTIDLKAAKNSLASAEMQLCTKDMLLHKAESKIVQLSVALETTTKSLEKLTAVANKLSRMQQAAADPLIIKGLVGFQAVARGYISRIKTSEKFAARLAAETNTLVPKRGTVLGTTGWYTGPDGSAYYFTLSKGDWILMSGPLKPDEYNMLMKKTKARGSEDALTEYGFPLTNNSCDQQQVFISNKTKKLYVVRLVDASMLA